MQFDSASSAQRWRRSERLRLELALAVLCALLLPPGRTASAGVAGSPQHPPACEKLALCSAGKLQPYNGDLDVPGEMAKAVAARSYNKELILLTTSPGPADGSYPRNMWNMVAMQALGNLADMGYEHVLLLSTDGEACRKIAAMMPRYGCAYSTGTLFKKEDKGTTIVLWVLRYRTLVSTFYQASGRGNQEAAEAAWAAGGAPFALPALSAPEQPHSPTGATLSRQHADNAPS